MSVLCRQSWRRGEHTDSSVQACNVAPITGRSGATDWLKPTGSAPSGGATPEPRNLEPGKPQALQMGAFRAEVIAAYRGDSRERPATFPGGRQKRVSPLQAVSQETGLSSFSECLA